MPTTSTALPKPPSRPTRWGAAIAKMKDGLSELQSLKEEYEDWMNNLPENAQAGPMYDKLQEIADLDLDGIEQSIDEIEMQELPRGFGKD